MFSVKHILLSFLIALLFCLPGCKKYPDGPSFSLLTKKSRLCGKWKLEKGFVNGIERKDSVFNYDVYYFTLNKNNKYIVSWLVGGIDYYEEGTWQWIEKKSSVYFKYDVSSSIYSGLSGGPTQPGEYSYKILRLQAAELWIQQIQYNGDVWDLHFIPNLPVH